MKCPKCGEELRKSVKNPEYGLCDNCRKKFLLEEDFEYEEDYVDVVDKNTYKNTCPRCGSNKINVQMVTENKLKRKNGCIYWILIGWWWETIMWLCFFLPMLFYKLFSPKKYTTKSTHKSIFVCQDCGNNWKS